MWKVILLLREPPNTSVRLIRDFSTLNDNAVPHDRVAFPRSSDRDGVDRRDRDFQSYVSV